jgi:hypothetical protein
MSTRTNFQRDFTEIFYDEESDWMKIASELWNIERNHIRGHPLRTIWGECVSYANLRDEYSRLFVRSKFLSEKINNWPTLTFPILDQNDKWRWPA